MLKSNGIKQAQKIFCCGLGWFFYLSRADQVGAQQVEILTPEPFQPGLPQTLPPEENLLQESLPGLPIPDAIINVPGTIIIERFSFVGNTVFTQAELQQAIAEFTGRSISFTQLLQAANAITELYVSRGYITSGAYIPEQNFVGNQIRIQILEGNLAELKVDISGQRLRKSYVRDRLAQKMGQPLNINQLQAALQLLQLNPLISKLQAELATGIEPGTNVLSVAVTPADTFILQANLNNNRNLSVGTWERGAELSEANLSGGGDKFEFVYNNTEGGNQFRGGYTIPISTQDATLSFNFQVAQNQIVQGDFEEVDLEIRTRQYDLSWRQPIWRQATPQFSRELTFGLTASRRESDGFIMGVPQALTPGADGSGEIRTSILSLNQEWLQRDRRQVFSVRSQFNFGLDVVDATILPEEPNGEFFSWRGQVSYLRLLNSSSGNSATGASMLLRTELQLSADPLIPTEQFSLGGINTVRGYRQDALLRDNGFLATAELRLPIVEFADLAGTLQLVPFIDFGTGWNQAPSAGETYNTLVGTGVGLLLETSERLSTRLDWGIPLVDGDSGDGSLQENGVYFQLETKLF